MAINLTTQQKEIGLRFFTSIISTGTGEKLDMPDEAINPNSQYFQYGVAATQMRVTACKDISDIILNTRFGNVDIPAGNLNGAYVIDLATSWRFAQNTDTTELCRCLAYGCYEYEIYWDDLSADPQDLAAFEATEFGKALRAFGCFESMRARREAGLGVEADPTIAQQLKKYRSHYKNSGDKLPDVRDAKSGLINPAPAAVMYRLIGDRFNPDQNTKPSVYIRPITSENRAFACEVNGTNKVFIGSAKGFAYFELYFKDLQSAQNMLIALNNAGRIPGNVKNLQAYAKRANIKNHNSGFVLIGTEFGDAYIIGKKTNNESLENISDDEILAESAEEEQSENIFEKMSSKEFREFSRDFRKYS